MGGHKWWTAIKEGQYNEGALYIDILFHLRDFIFFYSKRSSKIEQGFNVHKWTSEMHHRTTERGDKSTPRSVTGCQSQTGFQTTGYQ